MTCTEKHRAAALLLAVCEKGREDILVILGGSCTTDIFLKSHRKVMSPTIDSWLGGEIHLFL